jgi:GNAT superfamily N-acetyltransferase
MSTNFRPIEPADDRATSEVLIAAIEDLGRRTNQEANSTAGLPPDEAWERRRPLWEHLRTSSERGWLAERDGRIVGYARSILRDGLRELTEFFVLPDAQAGGIGRELLARAFPPGEGASNRVLIATGDLRAQGRYLRAGLASHFPIYEFRGAPEPIELETDLVAERIEPGDGDRVPTEAVDAIAALDLAVLGIRRDVDIAYLLRTRAGWLFRRGGDVVGYGLHGVWQGPFSALEPADLPAILAHAERTAAERGDETTGFEVGLVNRAAVGWLLERGYRMHPFVTFLMSDRPFGQFDRYVLTSPPIFI